MIHNRKSSMDFTVYNENANSQEWRNNEARDMFALLLEEYENSKRLNFPQRYKELERIISMFTSDPVLEKMKWLSEDEQEAEDYDDEPNEAVSFQNDLMSDENANGEDLSSNPTIGLHLRRLVSKMMTMSTFSTLSTVTSASLNPSSNCSSSPSTPISDISNISGISSSTRSSSSISPALSSSLLQQNLNISIDNTCSNINYATSNSNGNNDSNINSAPTTPVSTAHAPGLPHCLSLPLFKRFQSDTTDLPLSSSCSSYSFDRAFNPSTTTSSAQPALPRTFSSSSTETDGVRSRRSSSSQNTTSVSSSTSTNQRRNDFDKCIIKQNQIPAFEIPPLRTTPQSKSNAIDLDKIVPSLYIASNPSSPTDTKQLSRFRGSSSTSNIGRFFGLDANSYTKLSSNTKGFVSKIRHAIRKESKSENNMFEIGSISDSSESSYSLNFDIQRRHSILMKMKEEYDELPNWNVLSRYIKMKKMLKSCGKLDIE